MKVRHKAHELPAFVVEKSDPRNVYLYEILGLKSQNTGFIFRKMTMLSSPRIWPTSINPTLAVVSTVFVNLSVALDRLAEI